MCYSQTSSFLSLHILLRGSYMLHFLYAGNCTFSSLPDFSSALPQHSDLSTSKFKHIICSSPIITSLFFLHFLSWIMALSSTWLPNQISVVSSLTPLSKLCLFCLLFYLSLTFTGTILDHAIIASYLNCPNLLLT